MTRTRARKLSLRVSLVALLGLFAGSACMLPVFDWMAPSEIIRKTSDQEPPLGEPPEKSGPAAGRSAPRLVVLVSIDGLAPWVVSGVKAPNLRRLAREGTTALKAATVVPSYTMASHTSMISGVEPEVHGVLYNRYQPWSRIEVPTVFTICADAGLRCGLFAGKRKFAQFAEHEPGVDRYARAGSSDEVLRLALEWLVAADPDFLLVHLPEVDWAGHRKGWGSVEQRRAIERVDTLLGSFLTDALEASPRPLTVIVTADHGGHDKRHGSRAPEDVAIPWIAWGDGIAAGERVRAVSTVDTAPTVLRLLGVEPPGDWTGRMRIEISDPAAEHATGG